MAKPAAGFKQNSCPCPCQIEVLPRLLPRLLSSMHLKPLQVNNCPNRPTSNMTFVKSPPITPPCQELSASFLGAQNAWDIYKLWKPKYSFTGISLSLTEIWVTHKRNTANLCERTKQNNYKEYLELRKTISLGFWRRAWQPLQCFYLENLVSRGAWQATVHGVKSWTQLKQIIKILRRY